MIYRVNRKLKRIIVKGVGLLNGVNSKKYWDHRFSSNWEIQNGRTQSTLFASGFSLTKCAQSISPESVLDFGCGLADSIPVLTMAFPKAKLYFYDFSTVAMEKATQSMGYLASPYFIGDNITFDLVYCSNVIEHITEDQINEFLTRLINLSNAYVVIQAPFREYLSNGNRISAMEKSNETEHERTLDLDFVDFLTDAYPNFNWTYELMTIPVAWDKGQQVFFIGRKNQ